MDQTPGAPQPTDSPNGNGHPAVDAFADHARPPLLAEDAVQHGQSDQGEETHHPQGPIGVLALGALGVVYGDIGTSPLYTMREIFNHAGEAGKGESAVLGALSLVFWALILTVSVKYLVLILRADNRGEGGVLALARLAGNALPP
ncbi:MAG: KUP/HAK/KT family potassium transporter, partial [Reyranellaceae bacterium]